MKPQIKFRALKDDMSNCTFVFGQLVYKTEELSGKVYPAITEDGLSFTSCLPKTESQFTGLHDKNGKEIYEGDFLKLIDEYRGKGEKPSYVIFKDSQWMMQGTMHYTHVDSINNYCLDKMEIIGNIYENPELLK